METLSASPALCGENAPVIGRYPAETDSKGSFGIFICCQVAEAHEQTVVSPVIWDVMALIACHYNEFDTFCLNYRDELCAGTGVISYQWLSKPSIWHNDKISVSLQWRAMNVTESEITNNSTVFRVWTPATS